MLRCFEIFEEEGYMKKISLVCSVILVYALNANEVHKDTEMHTEKPFELCSHKDIFPKMLFGNDNGVFSTDLFYTKIIVEGDPYTILLLSNSKYQPLEWDSYTDEDIDNLIKFICSVCGYTVCATCLPPGWSQAGTLMCGICASRYWNRLSDNYGK